MFIVPLRLAEWLFRLPFMRRPSLLGDVVGECPDALNAVVIMVEVRDGHRK
jgi:hypothetical protein